MRRRTLWTALVVVLALLALAPVAAAQTDTPESVDWYARYWNNTDLDGTPVLERAEGELNYRWGAGSPSVVVQADRFSARWTAMVQFEPGTYRFTTTADDGIRVWLQDEWIIDDWAIHPAAQRSAERYLDGEYDLLVEYFEDTGNATAILTWEIVPDAGPTATISPTRGPAGTPITVAGSGFEAGAQVEVTIGRLTGDPVIRQTAVASANGDVRATIPVPAAARSGEPWVVRLAAGDQEAVSPRFTVTVGSPNVAGPSTCGPVYTVEPGDWLSRIARECNTTVEAIVAANPSLENPSLIYPGRQLIMPGHVGGDAEPQVVVDRLSAAPGTTLRVYAAGLEPFAEVVIGLALAPGNQPYFTTSVTTNANGELSTGLVLPPEAEPGQRWAAFMRPTANETVFSAPVTVTEAGAARVTPLYNLRLREGPSTATARLDVVPRGTTLEVRAWDETGDWAQVEYRGQIGWIAAWLAEVEGEAPASSTNEPPPTSPND